MLKWGIYGVLAVIATGMSLVIAQHCLACNKIVGQGKCVSSAHDMACDEYCLSNADCDAQKATMDFGVPTCGEGSPGMTTCGETTTSYICAETHKCWRGYHNDYCDEGSSPAKRFCRELNLESTTSTSGPALSGNPC